MKRFLIAIIQDVCDFFTIVKEKIHTISWEIKNIILFFKQQKTTNILKINSNYYVYFKYSR